MRLIIALILPWLTFFTIGRPLLGIVCLILQITLIGWLPATIWAVYALSQYMTDQKIEKALKERVASPFDRAKGTRIQFHALTTKRPGATIRAPKSARGPLPRRA